jgi:chemotaxis protein CheC
MTLVPSVAAPQPILAEILAAGLARAGDALAAMSGHEVAIVGADVVACGSAQLIEIAGGPDTTVVAVYIGITGPLHGHALLILPLDGAHRLAAILLDGMVEARVDGEHGGATLEFDALELSALQEVGNVTISACLNVLGQLFPEPVHPTVPQAVIEFAGAILDSVLLDLVADSDEILAARTTFAIDGEAIGGTIVILPDRHSLELLADASVRYVA